MRFSRTLCLLLAIFAAYYSFKALMPKYDSKETPEIGSFSTKRALEHVKALSLEPHAVGFKGHQRVITYITGELKGLGLEVELQDGYTAGDWGNLSRAVNIMARIKGSQAGEALLLLSHYDSNPHSSYGASDAGSGVATILEGVRAFLANNPKPKNDIIILISDAEELGLNGADLFVKEHPWTKDVKLVLNFEARGSGGPSYMLIETNRGNTRLIEEFTKANPQYPVANSLAYSIYKMLPNDTDLTVFREDADIEGFNFAFIDDHFDYHTALDTYERLDRNTLAHQGSYLMPLLNHFSNADLGNLKSLNDHVYFNVPFFRLVSYPFEWIWPMFGLAVVSFIVLILIGFKKKSLQTTQLFKGFIPVLLVLLINGGIGYIAWPTLTKLYPAFGDMLHGFTYNGHSYIWAFSLLALGICFLIYNRFRSISTANLLVAPTLVWLLISGLVASKLQGASFFVVPVFGLLVALLVHVNQEKPSPYLLLFLALPALLILTPFIKMFPVGLGLKLLIATTVFVTLIYFFLIPLLGLTNHKMRFAVITFLVCLMFSIGAHKNASFSKEQPKPSSLLYVYDADANTAKWASYDKVLIPWNRQFLGENESLPEDNLSNNTISSKYNTGFRAVSKAETKALAEPEIEVVQDTIMDGLRHLNICFTPKRNVNRLEVFTNDIDLIKASVNKIVLSEHYLANRRNGKLVTHYITDNDYTELQLLITPNDSLELTFFEASNDLLEHALFSVPDRPENSIPMPFVLNDAILITKKLKL
ncbi:M28 family peptidase [Croceitalea dokdonensis]|nr:M28 family peptidase [Croceitalea dokdonensis]